MTRKIPSNDGKYEAQKVTQTACGKYGYASRKLAATKAAESRRMTGEPIYPYHCPEPNCHTFHIGHRPARVWKKLGRKPD